MLKCFELLTSAKVTKQDSQHERSTASGFDSLDPRTFEPLTHGTFAHSQGGCNVFLFPPLLVQFPVSFVRIIGASAMENATQPSAFRG